MNFPGKTERERWTPGGTKLLKSKDDEDETDEDSSGQPLAEE